MIYISDTYRTTIADDIYFFFFLDSADDISDTHCMIIAQVIATDSCQT